MLLAEHSFLAKEVRTKVHQLLGKGDREVAITDFGIDAVSIGAATLVLQNLYDPTQLLNGENRQQNIG